MLGVFYDFHPLCAAMVCLRRFWLVKTALRPPSSTLPAEPDPSRGNVDALVPRTGTNTAFSSCGRSGGATSTATSGGVVAGGADVEPWVASQVDPFMSALRQALLRDRPGDVSAYASAFAADRQGT